MQNRISKLEEKLEEKQSHSVADVQATTEDGVHKRNANVIDEEKAEVTLLHHEGYSDAAVQTMEVLGPLPVSDVDWLLIMIA